METKILEIPRDQKLRHRPATTDVTRLKGPVPLNPRADPQIRAKDLDLGCIAVLRARPLVLV